MARQDPNGLINASFYFGGEEDSSSITRINGIVFIGQCATGTLPSGYTFFEARVAQQIVRVFSVEDTCYK
jgi:hypothetical protein